MTGVRLFHLTSILTLGPSNFYLVLLGAFFPAVKVQASEANYPHYLYMSLKMHAALRPFAMHNHSIVELGIEKTNRFFLVCLCPFTVM
jgi:hypothetical protein